MGDRKSPRGWLKSTLAERLRDVEMAAIWAEYNRRADLEEIEVKRRHYQRKLAQAQVAVAEGQRWAARAVEKYQRWLGAHERIPPTLITDESV